MKKSLFIIIIVFCLLIHLNLVYAETIKLNSSYILDDAYVDSGTGNKNRGISTDLQVQRNAYQRVYIKFNISSIPQNQAIDNSLLCLYMHTDASSQIINASHVYTHNWSEGSEDGTDVSGQDYTTNITWNNQPCGTDLDNSDNCNLTSESAITNDGDQDETWQCWNITNMVKKEYEENNLNVSVVLYTEDLGNPDKFYSKEYADSSLHPYLNITYSPIVYTAYVDDDFTESTTNWQVYNFSNISSALEVVEEGGTIHVAEGTYNEMPTISKSVNLVGEGYETIIQGDETAHVLTVSSNLVNISGFTITGSRTNWGDYYGIYLNSVGNCIIKENNITGNRRGIGMIGAYSNTIHSNYIVSSVDRGIYTNNWATQNNIIYNNYFDNTDNFYSASSPPNLATFNITKTLGTNILGGSYLGGNFWNLYSGTDENGDGLGDSSYNLYGSYYDYLPLVDNSAPTISLTSPKNKSLSQASVLNYSVSDSDENLQSCWYAINGEENNTITCGNNITGLSPNQGTNTYNIYANDTEGLESSDSVTFFLDSINPEIEFFSNTIETGDYSNLQSIFVNISISESNPSYSFINFNNSLIAFYKMNDSSTLLDYSGRGNHGTITNAIETEGKFGNALSFDGEGDYVNIDRDDFDFPLAPFTISFWAKENSETPENQKILGTHHTQEILISGEISGEMGFWAGGYKAQIIVNKNANEWHHLVMTINASGDRNVYIDNELHDFGTKPLPIAGTQDFQIGSAGGYNDYFNGSIDEVLIFERALSSEEVSKLYSASDYSNNFTELEYGTYSFYSYTQDIAGNENQTETRTIELSANSPPSLSLLSPQNGNTYGYNESLQLNYSVSDSDNNLDSCWYAIDGNSNTTLNNCQNSTFNISEGSHTLNIYANDTNNEISSDQASFTIQVGAPSISNLNPSNKYLKYYQINFSYTPEDIDLQTCELWGNFDGTFKFNQSQIPSNGIENNFTLNLQDNTYLWNIRCNDSLGNSAFNGNKTFYIDTINPEIAITQPIGTKTSRTIPLTFTATDSNLETCFYNVYRGVNLEVSNTTTNCSSSDSFSVTVDADFSLNLYVNDSAGNSNFTQSNFSVDTSTPVVEETPAGGGGGGGSPSAKIKADDLESVVIYPGEQKILSISAKNNGKTSLTNCKVSGGGEYSDWIKSTFISGITGFEQKDFPFSLYVPVEAESKEYEIDIHLVCTEASISKKLPISILEKFVEFDIYDIRERAGNLEIEYYLKDLSSSEQTVQIEFKIENLEEEIISEYQEEIVLSVQETKSLSASLNLPENIKGEHILLINLAGNGEISKQETIIIGNSGFTGLAIFGDYTGVVIPSLIIILIAGSIAFFMVRRIVKAVKHNKKKKSVKGVVRVK